MRINSPSNMTNLAVLIALWNWQHSPMEIIARLLEILKSLPEGEARGKLLDGISCLDVIAEVMRRALESGAGQIAWNGKEAGK
jgi:hypothetical protein